MMNNGLKRRQQQQQQQRPTMLSFLVTILLFVFLVLDKDGSKSRFVGMVVVSAESSSSSSSTTQECELNDENGECMATTKNGKDEKEGADGSTSCRDYDSNCMQWASQSKCRDGIKAVNTDDASATADTDNTALLKSADWVKQTCPKSCRICWSCEDTQPLECAAWAKAGECNANPRYMFLYCPSSCQICHHKGHDFTTIMEQREKAYQEQKVMEAVDTTPYGMEQNIRNDAHQQEWDKMKLYMDTRVQKEPMFATVRKDCRLRNKDCIIWSERGECELKREYMIVNCAPACQTCEMLDFNNRCPYDPNEETALKPGDMNRMFETIVSTMTQYEPHVLSMPKQETTSFRNGSTMMETTGDDDSNILDGPWVITLDAFLTPEECQRMIELGGQQGYLESADVGKKKFDGTYDMNVNGGRTSTNAWCQNDCETDPVTEAIVHRMEQITGIPQANFEYLQLLKYEENQFYQRHHDYIDFHIHRKQGPRSLTIFLYLNNVEAGGGTNFPLLNNMTVYPKQGRALIWPSTKNEKPDMKDPRTDHQALPVEKGVKYGANAWLHQRDFKEPFKRACI